MSFVSITIEKYIYEYYKGCFICKKPITAKYNCSIGVLKIIANKH